MKLYTLAILMLVFFTACTTMTHNAPPGEDITTYDECVRAGNLVMESYPRQCATPDGKHFVEEIDKPVCKNLCGDGRCEEFVCLAIGCPCAESAETCPEDCNGGGNTEPSYCPAIYQPVCGLVNVQCIRAPCPPQYQTFSNSCELSKNSLAKFVHEGACEKEASCGNGLCEAGEADDCPVCTKGEVCSLRPCFRGTCAQDCAASLPKGTPCCYTAPGMCSYTGEQSCRTGKSIDCSAPACNPLVR